MLSATVTAVLSGGNLTLTGNKNAAYVEVHETATTGTFLVTGLSGTKISRFPALAPARVKVSAA